MVNDFPTGAYLLALWDSSYPRFIFIYLFFGHGIYFYLFIFGHGM